MKHKLLLLLCCLPALPALAGWTVYTTTFEGQERTYKCYTPTNLMPGAKVVVLIHGLSTTMNDYDASSWPAIADTANIILVAPQGLPFNCIYGEVETSAFNSGLVWPSPSGDIAVNAELNDVGFIGMLLDSVAASFDVDTNRFYVTGFSNGGMMTQRVACELANRFSAAASVSGARSVALPSCPTGTMLPIAHFHGDADAVVQWNGYVDAGMIRGAMTIQVDTLIAMWRQLDDATATIDSNIIGDAGTALYMTHYAYKTTAGIPMVALYKIHNGVHDYYGYNLTGMSFDIAHESWKFFNQHTQHGALPAPAEPDAAALYTVYPNPAGNLLFIKGNIAAIDSVSIISTAGSLLLKQKNSNGVIDVSHLSEGVYFIKIANKQGSVSSIQFVK